MEHTASPAGQAVPTHARTTRRGLMGGVALALAAAPAVAAAPKGVATADTLADDGPAFLAWEAEHDARLAEACAIIPDEKLIADPTVEVGFRRAAHVANRILSTPCSSRAAALVKLRTLLHPETGMFSCGEGEHDETALQQVLAVLGDHRGEWTAPASQQAFPAALAAWREAEDAYGEVTNRLDQEDVYEAPEIDAADRRSARALAALVSAPTPTRAALADKLQVLAERDHVHGFIAALRRGEG